MQASKALFETVRFTAVHAGLYPDARETSGPWLVTGAVLMAQQAAAMALKASDDAIPAQAGATELLLRAANRERLPPPYTLPFGMAARQGFDRLVEARNSFMHPRGIAWHVSDHTLALGLPVAAQSVRHLVLVQPIQQDLIEDVNRLRQSLDEVAALAEFLA